MVIGQFIVFCSFLYLIGRGLVIGIDKISLNKLELLGSKISGININNFFILLALFFLGNFAFIINFFSGTN